MEHDKYEIEYVYHPPFKNDIFGLGGWWCAYVILDNITEEKYPNETYRHGNKIGVDTILVWRPGMSEDDKKVSATMQIEEIIEEHERRLKE